MVRKQFRILPAALAFTCLAGLPGCGHDQQLQSISIQPATEIFGTASNLAPPGAQAQLRALGSYIHPPVTKDITNLVTWNSNTPDIATVNSTGVVTVTGIACGDALISATVTTNNSLGNLPSNGAIVTSSMTATVTCPSGP
ncbi:MAG: Ig-like domain-containing protein [Acidobacteriota bacterium]|nr:Ig-like domain-containing protein [Acidobacteriota bacterium]